jgi:hypothetical protein
MGFGGVDSVSHPLSTIPSKAKKGFTGGSEKYEKICFFRGAKGGGGGEKMKNARENPKIAIFERKTCKMREAIL